LFHDLIPGWRPLILIGAKVLCLAVAFEFIAWWAGRRLEKVASPFIALDRDRDPKWRATRRATLKTAPKILSRSLIYTIGMILVFQIFQVPVLPLSLSVAAVSLLLGAAFVPTMRDYAQGYMLLCEDSLAPGDMVNVNGHEGTVEKWTLRGTWIRSRDGRLHVLANRDIHEVTIVQRAEEPRTELNNGLPHDPLAEKPKLAQRK
jgi:small conductance mechanosensitive channel